MKSKIALFCVFFVLIAIFSGCSSQSKSENLVYQNMTKEEEYVKMAQFYVANLHIFSKYEGYNLRLLEAQELECDDCYKFFYKFDTDHPDMKEKNVVAFQVNVDMRSGDIENVYVLEVIHDEVETLNISCETDFDCRVPYNYALSSTCPYESHCVESKCKVICPSFNGIISHDIYDESQLKAIEIAKNYLTTIESFKKYKGRNIKVLNVMSARCNGCFNVELLYEIDSEKNTSVTDSASANVVLSEWKVIDSVLSQGSKEEMSLDKALYVAQNSDCINAGKLTSEYYYNNKTKTWWIELDAQEGVCNPACVISEDTREAHVNWRC